MSKNSENSTNLTEQKEFTGTLSESAGCSENKTACFESKPTPPTEAQTAEEKVTCFEFKPYEGTPFATTRVEDRRLKNGYLILLAGLPASPKIFKTREEAEAYIDSKPWDLITGLVLNSIIKNNEQPFQKTK